MSALAAEVNGIEKVPHVREKMAELIQIAELGYAAGYTASAMEVVSNLLERAGSELQELAAQGSGLSELEEKAILMFVEVQAPEKTIIAIRKRLDALLKDLQKLAEFDHDDPGTPRYRLMLAYYPLIKPPAA